MKQRYRDWEKKIDRRKATQLRISRWAGLLRRLWNLDAPNPNYYSQQSWINGRIDHETLRAWLDDADVVRAVIETEERLMVMRDFAPATYAAVYIHYVRRDAHGMALEQEDQLRLFKKETGLGKTSFYEKLREAERDIGLLIG